MNEGPHQPKEIFISYVSEDQDLRRRVFAFLSHIGASTYFDRDPANIMTGDYEIRLTNAISQAKMLLVIWTDNFAQKKGNKAKLEIKIAQSKGISILPLWFDDSKDRSEFLYQELKSEEGVEFFKEQSNPWKTLYDLLRNSGIAVKEQVDLSPQKGDKWARDTEGANERKPLNISEVRGADATAQNTKPEPVKAEMRTATAKQSPLFLHPSLNGWCSGEMGELLRQLISLGPDDDKTVVEFVKADAIEQACQRVSQAQKTAITFATLRLNLICNLIAFTKDGNAQAALRAMACMVALRHSPCLARDAGFECDALAKSVESLCRQMVDRAGERPVAGAGPWTFSEHMGYEEEIAGQIERNGGVVIQMGGRPTPFAFGPAFVKAYDNGHRLEKKAVSMPAIQELLAFSSDVGMAAYLWRQGHYARLLETCAETLSGYIGMPHHDLHRSATRFLADSAVFVIAHSLTINNMESGSCVCEQIRRAIHYLLALEQAGCVTEGDRNRLHRALVNFGQSLDSGEVSDWLQSRLEELNRDLSLLSDERLKALCCQTQRRVVCRAACAAYHRSDFDRALALMKPYLKVLDELPDENIDILFRTLTQLALRSPKPHLVTMRLVLDEKQRRSSGVKDLESWEAILQQIGSLAGRDELLWFEEQLSRYEASPDSGQIEGLLVAAEGACNHCLEAGDADAVVRLLARLPSSLCDRTEQLLLKLIANVEDRGVQQRLADSLLKTCDVPTCPSMNEGRSAIKPVAPSEFVRLYACAETMEKINLRLRVRCSATQMFERGTYSEALGYLSDIEALVPGDPLLEQLSSDLVHEWSDTLVKDPEALMRFQRATCMPDDRRSAPRVDVQVPEPPTLAKLSSPRGDPERAAVLRLLDKLDASEAHPAPTRNGTRVATNTKQP